MASVITTADISVISTVYGSWITKDLVFNFDAKVAALKAVASLFPPVSTVTASLAFLDEVSRVKADKDPNQLQAVSNHLRNAARALFPTPAAFVTFCLTEKVSAAGKKVDPINYIWVAVVYLSMCASDVNAASMSPSPSVTWESIAQQMDLSKNFGAKNTPFMSGNKGSHASVVDGDLYWVGHIIDMAVRVQKWNRSGTAPVDPWVRSLSIFVGLPL